MHIAKVDLAFEVAIGMALQWDTDPPVTRRRNSPLGRESDWTDPATLFLVICELYGLDSRASLETILDSHPGIPVGFSEPTGLLFLPLNSLEMTFAHGTEMNNCLWENHAVASYMADGAALYAIKVNGIAVGTIALNREVNERDQNIKVLEISGQNNQSVGEELGELAQSLADSWNAECSSMKWTRYYAQCRRLLLG